MANAPRRNHPALSGPQVTARRVVGLGKAIRTRQAATICSSSARQSATRVLLQPRRKKVIWHVLPVAAGNKALMPARSERDAYPYAPPPHHTASLSDLAVEKFEALRQTDHRKYFEAGPARGVIDQSAGNRRQLRAHDDLGLACLRSRGPNALIEPRELAFCHNNPWCMYGGYGTLKGQWLKIAGGVDLTSASDGTGIRRRVTSANHSKRTSIDLDQHARRGE